MSVVQTPAFDALNRTSLIVDPKPLSDLEYINSIYQDSEVVVTIVGDGSKTTLQVIDTNTLTILDIEYDDVISKELISGSANICYVGFTAAQENLDDLLSRLSQSKIGPSKLQLSDVNKTGIVSGISGLVANADKKPSIIELFAKYGFDASKVYLGGDVDLAKQLIGAEGAILIAGTGSICFSKSQGIEKRIGGFGYALGDEGSCFYIGKLALTAALKSKFEKSSPFALTDKLCELLGIATIEEAIKLFYNGTIKPGDVAKAAPFVFDAAFKQNDAQCKLIIEQTAEELAAHIAIAVQNSNEPNFPIYLIGDAFKIEHADLFIDMICKKVVYSPGVKLINVSEANLAMQVIVNQAKANKYAAPALTY